MNTVDTTDARGAAGREDRRRTTTRSEDAADSAGPIAVARRRSSGRPESAAVERSRATRAQPARERGRAGARPGASDAPWTRLATRHRSGSSSQPRRGASAGRSSGASSPPHAAHAGTSSGAGTPLGTNHLTPQLLHLSRRSVTALSIRARGRTDIRTPSRSRGSPRWKPRPATAAAMRLDSAASSASLRSREAPLRPRRRMAQRLRAPWRRASQPPRARCSGRRAPARSTS